MIKQIFFTFVIVNVTVAVPYNVTINECGPEVSDRPQNSSLKVILATIEGCDSDPCVLVKLNSYFLHARAIWDFYANSTNKITIRGVIVPRGTPTLDILRHDLCKELQTGFCDNVVPGTIMDLQMSQQVTDFTPAYDGDIRYYVYKDEEVMYCGQSPIIIRDQNITFETTVSRASGLGGFGGYLIPG